MNAKIERAQRDIEKTRAKITDLQASLREQERRKLELENTEIVDTVRGLDISLADLAAMLKATQGGGAASGQVGPKSAPEQTAAHTNEQEEDAE